MVLYSLGWAHAVIYGLRKIANSMELHMGTINTAHHVLTPADPAQPGARASKV